MKPRISSSKEQQPVFQQTSRNIWLVFLCNGAKDHTIEGLLLNPDYIINLPHYLQVAFNDVRVSGVTQSYCVT